MIRILLIDDSPETFISNDKRYAPSFDEGFGDENKKDAYKKHFALQWLQSPDDAQDYLSLSNEVSTNQGDHALAKLSPPPHIVIFDYRMAPGWGRNQSWPDDLSDHIPTFRLAGSLKQPLLRDEPKILLKNFYEKEGIVNTGKKEANTTRENLIGSFTGNDDNLGCYAGALVVQLFNNHPCVGIPVTSKGQHEIKGEALYFEWLLDKQFDGLFGYKYSTSPLWDELIPKALKVLRERIINMIKVKKITPDLKQIVSLSQMQALPEAETGGSFNFTSVYGQYSFPLDGLFIDYEQSERLEAINTWAMRMLKALPLSYPVIEKAKNAATTIWDKYKTGFYDRILISEFTSRTEPLTSAENKLYTEVKARMKLTTKTGLITEKNECSIQTLFHKDDDRQAIRLAVLIVVTEGAIALQMQRVASEYSADYPVLTADEYFNMLFPYVNLKNGLILPMHCDTSDEKDKLTDAGIKWLMSHLSLNEVPIKQGKIFLMEDWISPGERAILQSIFYKDAAYYPAWLS